MLPAVECYSSEGWDARGWRFGTWSLEDGAAAETVWFLLCACK